VLFPSPHANPDGLRSFAYATFSTRLARWCQQIGLHDETGQAVSVTAHQFRHTLGTRLINAGVPQHVVQKMLGHASPQMTARYATLHDSTVRAAFDEYQQLRVNIDGNQLDFDPDASTADAEWIKHNLARAQASLPNGYCGRPPQQDCPHPNACLTCPDFQTTPTFLPIHSRQHDDTLELIEIADQHGNQRLAANHRRVAANLQNVITALKTSTRKPPMPTDNSAYLTEATRRRSEQARTRAIEAIRRLDRDGTTINYVTVSVEQRAFPARCSTETRTCARRSNGYVEMSPHPNPGSPPPSEHQQSPRSNS